MERPGSMYLLDLPRLPPTIRESHWTLNHQRHRMAYLVTSLPKSTPGVWNPLAQFDRILLED